MTVYLCLRTLRAAAAYLIRRFAQTFVLRHRIVFHDLTLEDPDLDPAGAVGRLRSRYAIIDVGSERVQGHAPFAVPLHPGDFSAAQATGTVDTDALCAQAHRRLHRTLHRATESHAALELL